MPLDLSKTKTGRRPIPTSDPETYMRTRTPEEFKELAETFQRVGKKNEAVDALPAGDEKKALHAERESEMGDLAVLLFNDWICDEHGDPPLQQSREDILALGGQILVNYITLLNETIESLGKRKPSRASPKRSLPRGSTRKGSARKK